MPLRESATAAGSAALLPPAHGAGLLFRWWCPRRRTYGWCCGWCHPPDHLQPEQVRWEPAPEPTGPLL